MTSKRSLSLATVILIASAAFLIQQHRAQLKLRDENSALRQEVERLTTEALGFSNQVAQATRTQTGSDNQLRELLRLRGEVSALKRQLADTATVAERSAQATQPQTAIDPQSEEQLRQFAMARMRDAMVWVLAFVLFAKDHQERFPTSFDQTASYLEEALRNNLNPGDVLRDKEQFAQSANQFEIVYQGLLNEITNRHSTIVMREKEAFPSASGGWNRTYGFADGHTEIHKADDGNFGPWEAQHIQKKDAP